MDCSPPSPSVHGIFQSRILEGVAIPFFRGSSQPRDWNWISHIAADSLPSEPVLEASANPKQEKERYTRLSAEFQRARRDRKAFLSEQCKEMEENNRIGKTRDFFKEISAWRIPGMGEPGGLPSMGSHRVGHDWSDLAAAAAALSYCVSSSSSDHYLNSAFCCHLWFCLPVHCLSVPSQWDLCVGTWIFHW